MRVFEQARALAAASILAVAANAEPSVPRELPHVLRLEVATVTSGPANIERELAAVLKEEVSARIHRDWGDAREPQVQLHLRVAALAGGAESYAITRLADAAGVARLEITGHDARGLVYAVGRLLRETRVDSGTATLNSARLPLASGPRYPLRGVQLGYRPKTNSYDGWSPAMWDRYIREQAFSGANCIELVAPVSDDDEHSPHFVRTKPEMLRHMSSAAERYGPAPPCRTRRSGARR